MKEALHRAAASQIIDRDFLEKLIKVFTELDAVAVYMKEYREKNEEHGTAQLKIRATGHVSAARKWFTYLDKILAVDPHELHI